jgi:hypothetical protein
VQEGGHEVGVVFWGGLLGWVLGALFGGDGVDVPRGMKCFFFVEDIWAVLGGLVDMVGVLVGVVEWFGGNFGLIVLNGSKSDPCASELKPKTCDVTSCGDGRRGQSSRVERRM